MYQISASAENFDILDQICAKRVFLDIQIRLATKASLKLIVLTFWTKFTQKEHFRLKTKKVSTAIEFCIFKLVQVFDNLDQICPISTFLVENEKSEQHH